MFNPSTGKLKTNGYVINNGTSSQFLKADGSVDSNSYALSSHTHSYLPSEWLGTVDCNNISDSRVVAGYDWTNGPSNIAYGSLVNLVYDSLRTGQLLLSTVDNTLYFRTKEHNYDLGYGVWGDWLKIYSTGNFNPSNYSLTTHNHSGVYSEVGHTHSYLPLSGGTVTGNLQVRGTIFAYRYSQTGGDSAPAIVYDKPGGSYTGIGCHGTADTIWFGAVDGNFDWNDSKKQIWDFNGTIKQQGVALGSRAFDSTSYLPLSGGMLTSSQDTEVLSLKSTLSGAAGVYHRLYVGDTSVCETGWWSTLGWYAQNEHGEQQHTLSLRDDGSLMVDSSTVYHSGNFIAGTNYQAPIPANTYAPYNSAGYLPLTGGTTTGSVTITGLLTANNYRGANGGSNKAAIIYDKPSSNWSGLGPHTSNDTIWFGACTSSGEWVDSYYQKWVFNGDVVANKAITSYSGIQVYESTSDTSYRTTIDSDGANGGYIYHYSDSLGTFGNLLLNYGGGRVGVGTGSPSYTFDVVGNSSWTGHFKGTANEVYLADSTNGGIYIGSTTTSSGYYLLSIVNGQSTLGSGGSSAFFVRGDGNVGVGTTSPVEKFQVHNGTGVFSRGNGSQTISSDTWGLIVGCSGVRDTTANNYYPGIAFNHMWNYSGTGAGSYKAYPQAWIGLRLYDTPGSERSHLVFATKEETSGGLPVERMCIDPFGKVGIGTTSPSYKLDISGSFNATSIYLNGTQIEGTLSNSDIDSVMI